MTKEIDQRPSAARKAQLEVQITKLQQQILECFDEWTKRKLAIKCNELQKEYNLYYND